MDRRPQLGNGKASSYRVKEWRQRHGAEGCHGRLRGNRREAKGKSMG